MSTTLLLVLVAGLFVVGALLNIVLVWLICRLWRVKDATWWRSTRVVLIILVANGVSYALLFAFFWMERAWRILSEGMLGPAAMAVMSFVGIVVPLWAFCWGFKISFGKSLGIFVSLIVASSLLAYPLAFAFRFALAEAFVVPTGAMAPTVLGQHIRVRCPNCGREVDVGASEGSIMRYGWHEIVQRGYDCQQCGEARIPLRDAELISGDRLLVDKTDREPRRFEIAVFRVRAEQLEPFMPNAQTLNYVKRCVALPGEKIDIVDGDLFIDGQRLQKGPHEVEDLWIAVHDTDFRPREAHAEGPGWRSTAAHAGGWKLHSGEWQVRSDADSGSELQFHGPMTDLYAYELPDAAFPGVRPVVRDWRITVDLGEFAGDGALGFFWQHGERSTCLAVTPQAAVQVFGDTDRFTFEDDAPETANSVRQPFSRLSFAVRDGKAYLSIDGEVLATVDLEPLGVDEASAALADGEVLPRFGIVARRCDATLRRIQLHRDVFFRTRRQMEPWGRTEYQDSWQLGDEYFFLGDQSPQSQDCRFIGPIHQREMLGVVRWCYWPPERLREFPRH